MIEKRGNKYCLMSQTKDKKGKRKNLGCYSSKEGALKREKQVIWFKNKKDEGAMNIKKSQIYEMIKEELEVILTNDEAQEMFDLDPAALLDAMMKEVVSVSTKDIVESNGIVTSSAESGPQQRGTGRLNKRPGTHSADRASTANPGVWAQKERQEIVDRLKGIKADGQYSDEEKAQLLLVQALEGLLNDVLDIVFRDEESYKEHRGEVTAQLIRLQQGLKRIVGKAAAPEVDAPAAGEAEPGDLEEANRSAKGNVTQAARKKHATLSDGRFPVFDDESALSALKLRGHDTTAAERKKIINKAAQYVPEAAKKAREEDKKKG